MATSPTTTARFLLTQEAGFALSRALGLSRNWGHMLMMWARRSDSDGLCGSMLKLEAAAYKGRQPLYAGAEILHFIRAAQTMFPSKFAGGLHAPLGQDYTVPAVDLRPALGSVGARVRLAVPVRKRP